MNVRIRILEWRAMRRFFNLVLGGLAMVVVAMVSAFLAMRLAIHGSIWELRYLLLQEGDMGLLTIGPFLRMFIDTCYRCK